MTWRGPATNRTAAGQARARDYRSAEHKAERKRRVAAATPLTPCMCPGKGRGGCKHHTGYCGRPLGPNSSMWHLPHLPDRSGYAPGLWCAGCNRSEASRRGALVTNAQRKAQRLIRATPTYRW